MTSTTRGLPNLADGVAAAEKALVRVGRRHGTSGVAWASDVVVTVAHGLPDSGPVHVGLPDGRTVEGLVVGRDQATDLGVVRLPADAGLVPVQWADAPPRLGELVIIAGRGWRGAVANLGMVAQVGGPWRTGLGAEVDAWIDVNGSLGRGMSGGLLLDSLGKAVGLNTAGLVRGGTTVPASTVRAVVEALLAHGRVGRARLGVSVQGVSLAPAQQAVAGRDQALLVLSVEAGSATERGGVLVGDALLELDGEAILESAALLARLRSLSADAGVKLSVLRGAERVELELAF